MLKSCPTALGIDPNTPLEELLDQDWSHRIPQDKLHRISIAPMLDVTNVHFRFFMRLLTRYSTLWTEMIHSNTLHFNAENREYFLRFHPIEHPVVLQLGGNDAETLATAGTLTELRGYDEVNINCGCPSERVQNGCFGAVLMKDPHRVAACVKHMRQKLKIPVHVKCRIGVDDEDSYDFVKLFVEVVANEGGCQHFIIHSRKCLLKGLSPAQNRSIPPLKYEVVKQLKKDFPHLQFTINGGVKTYDQIDDFLDDAHGLAGVMLGRAAYDNPWMFSDVDRRYYGLPNPGLSRKQILKIWGQYADKEMVRNEKLAWPTMLKPIINLFNNERNCAIYRRMLSDRETYKKMKKFSEFMDYIIEEFEKLNSEALNAVAPSMEPTLGKASPAPKESEMKADGNDHNADNTKEAADK